MSDEFRGCYLSLGEGKESVHVGLKLGIVLLKIWFLIE